VDLKSAFSSLAGSHADETTTTTTTTTAAQVESDSKPIYETPQPPPPLPERPQSQMPVTVPCQYRTGRTLGSGTYAIVKEAIHIQTGKYYACKVINKRLMEGREHMVRNEIAVLKRVSSGHRNIVTLHDYFETAHNLYLCFDLCTGGELFDRICAKGNYYEADAAALVRTVFKAVKYIHDSGIVHRDLKPENLLFRTSAEDADIMVADFGLSRVMEEEKHNLLTEICGTPGYMAPEIFLKTGHGKPVDVWAMGVITYFLLAGYTPFDRDTQQQEMQAIIAGDYRFEPEEYWQNVSTTAKEFVTVCLTVDPAKRPTADESLQHKWLADEEPHFVPDPTRSDGGPADLLPNVKKAFNAKKLWRKATSTIRAVNRMATLVNVDNKAVNMRKQLDQFKEESEKEILEHANVTYQAVKKSGEVSPTQEISNKMEKANLQPDSPGKGSNS
jgi:serine/threonine protein kinase